MGHKIYGEEEPKRAPVSEFIENLICGFMAFIGCIGGWLVHFGMHLWWMLGLSAVIAGIFALHIVRK